MPETRKPRRLGLQKGQQMHRYELQESLPPEKALILLKQELSECRIKMRFYRNRETQIRKLIRYLEKECGRN